MKHLIVDLQTGEFRYEEQVMSESKLEKAAVKLWVETPQEDDKHFAQTFSRRIAKWIYEQAKASDNLNLGCCENIGLKDICEIEDPKPVNPMPEIKIGYKVKNCIGHEYGICGNDGDIFCGFCFRDDLYCHNLIRRGDIVEILDHDDRTIWKIRA